MSDAIRCGQCRWWRQYEEDTGFCEFNPPMFIPDRPGRDPIHSWSWEQPRTDIETSCSRGERKASNLTVSDGDPVAMVDGLPVFRAKLTEDAT